MADQAYRLPGTGPPETEEDRLKRLRKPLVLTEYQRTTLVRCADHWGDEMYRLIEERKEAASEDRLEWMGDQLSGWYEVADALRMKRGVK